MIIGDGVEHIRVNELQRYELISNSYKCFCGCYVSIGNTYGEDLTYSSYSRCMKCNNISWNKYKLVEKYL